MWTIKRVRQGIFVCVALFAATILQAQTTTGRIIGLAADEGAAALPGVTITIDSPVLIGGTRTQVSDSDGYFSFIGLAPGEYTVRADLSGYVGQEMREVKVPLGGAVSLNVVMALGTFSGEIEVTAETPIVDPTQVNTGLIYDRKYLLDTALGSNNRAYQLVLAQAPGVSDDRNPRVFGSSQTENAYFVDGINTTDPATATFGTNFNFDAIQEIQFQTGGFEAEYGMATGGIINLVTKSGGNQFSGILDVRYSQDSFQSSGDHYDSSEQTTSFRDIGATLGGPILRDSLWFFASYQYVTSERTPTNSPNTREFTGQYPIAKLTWQISPSWRASAKYTADPAEISNVNASYNVARESGAFKEQGASVLSADLNAALSSNLLWNVTVGSFRSELNVFPNYTDLSVNAHQNAATGYWYNSFQSQQYSERNRDEFSTDLTWFVDDLAGNHEFKGGVRYQDLLFNSGICNTGTPNGETCAAAGVSGYWYLELPGGQPYLMNDVVSPGLSKDTGVVGSAYLQDAWRVAHNLTLKLGVRYDQAKYTNDAGEEVADLNKWQPRAALAWDITGDSKNVFRANYGLYMHPNSTTLPEFVNTKAPSGGWWSSCSTFFGMDAATCQGFAGMMGWGWTSDPENQDPAGWLLPPTGAGSQLNQIDPNLKAVYTEEFILAYERQLGRRAGIEFSYVNKKTKNMFEDTCNGNWPGPASAGSDCSYFIMANLPELKRSYEGFMVKYETRSFNWLTLLTSYTYSKSKGSQDEGHVSPLFDRYPSDYINRFGYMGDQRLHRFKLNGSIYIKGDWNIGFDGLWSSDFRWQPIATYFDDPSVPPGHQLFVEPRGAREANPNYQLDLQLSKGFTVGGRMRFVLIGTVYNTFSSEQPTGVCQSVSGCGVDSDFNPVEAGDATMWQRPRSYEVGFRFEF